MIRTSRAAAFLSSLILTPLLMSGAAGETIVSLELVADTSTVPPGDTAAFSSLRTPSINNGRVVFRGLSLSQNDGVYRHSGSGLEMIADRSTVNPGPIGPANILSGFGNASVDANGDVAFRASVANSGTTAVYTSVGGALQQTISRDQPVPDLPGQIFLGFNTPQMEDGLVTVDGLVGPSGSGGNFNIIRQTPTTVERLASLGQTMPGGTQPFTLFGSPVTENGKTAFLGAGTPGSGQQSGIFSDASGSLQPIALSGVTQIPGTTQTFYAFGGVAVDRDGEDIVFYGLSADFNTRGIYGYIDGVLTTLVDNNTLLPGSTTETFSPFGFQGFGYDNGNLIFNGQGTSSSRGVFAIFEGELIELAVGGGEVAGVPNVFNFFLSEVDQSISGNEFAFTVQGNTSAIVRGTIGDAIPEPSSALIAAGALAAGVAGRRRRVWG